MEHPEEEIHVKIEEASAGAKNHGVRYVLAISMALMIIAFLLVYMFRSGHS